MAQPTNLTTADWSTIRAQYVEGIPAEDGTTSWPSLRDLCERFGVGLTAIAARSSGEEWPRARAMYQRRVEEQRQNARVEEIARIAADLDVSALKAARDGLAITHARIQEIGLAANRRMAALAQDRTPSDPPVDALELERLARALDEWYEVATKSIGMGPRSVLDVNLHAGEADDDEARIEERDTRTLGVYALIKQFAPDMMPAHLEDVIDVGSHVVALIPGGDPPGVGGVGDPEGEPVSADVADIG